jgi:hypothetical protein
MRLAHALIAKSIADSVFVITLGLIFYLSAFPPYFHGWGEVSRGLISGWVVDHSAPWSRVEAQLFVDGKFVAAGAANQSRPDVLNSGWTRDEWHGYSFTLPTLPAGWHEARVYALHASGGGARQSLQLVGDPIRFRVDEHGSANTAEEGAR